jgi:uncharacterized membrane protein
MNKIVFISFPNENMAYEGAEALRELRTNTLYAGAVIAQDPSGKIIVKKSDIERPAATLGGLLIGSLVGLLGPAAVAIDSGGGALLGAAIHAAKAGITTDFLETVQKELASGKTGIIADLDEEWETPIDIRMEPLGGTVFRQTRTQFEDAFVEKEIEAEQAELAHLEGEQVANANVQERQKAAETNARLQAKIEATKRKIQEKQNQLVERIKSVRREGEQKVALLKGQMIDANDEAKVRIAERVEDIRAEYQFRGEQLSEALERRKKAHAA